VKFKTHGGGAPVWPARECPQAHVVALHQRARRARMSAAARACWRRMTPTA
jgi:hypothetical protein